MKCVIFLISFILSAWLVGRKNVFGISGFLGSIAGLFLTLAGVAMYGCFLTVTALIAVIDVYVCCLRKRERAFVDYRLLH